MTRKLTVWQVRRIREVYASGGVTVTALARRFGVSRPLVSAVIHGHRHPDKRRPWPGSAAWPDRVDWEGQTDDQIAARRHLSKEWVRKVRAVVAPDTVRPRGDVDPATADWSKTNQELAATHGKHPNTWGRWRRVHAPETVRPRGRPIETR